jgi:hypothetical protein
MYTLCKPQIVYFACSHWYKKLALITLTNNNSLLFSLIQQSELLSKFLIPRSNIFNNSNNHIHSSDYQNFHTSFAVGSKLYSSKFDGNDTSISWCWSLWQMLSGTSDWVPSSEDIVDFYDAGSILVAASRWRGGKRFRQLQLALVVGLLLLLLARVRLEAVNDVTVYTSTSVEEEHVISCSRLSQSKQSKNTKNSK